MKFSRLDIDDENPDISIINTIEDKKFVFFEENIINFINDFDSEESSFFQKYLNMYIFDNLWNESENDIYFSIIKYIYSNDFESKIIYFNSIIENKDLFWYKLVKQFVFNEKLKNDNNINLIIQNVGINLIKLVDSGKLYLINKDYLLDIKESWLYYIVLSPIDIVSLQTKEEILLIFLKNKEYRKVIIEWCYNVLDYTNIIKTDTIGNMSNENVEDYSDRIDKLNNATKFGSICLKLFYRIWKGGIKFDESLEKIKYNFITSKVCNLNFCEPDDNNETTQYNFLTYMFFILYKLFDNVYISSYYELQKRDSILSDIEFSINQNDIEFTEIEKSRINCIEFNITKDLFNIPEFISYTCKWIIKNPKIKIGSLDEIINLIQVYYTEEPEVEHTPELFKLFNKIIYLEETENTYNDNNFTNNTMLKIKCIEIIYSFMERPTFSDDWHLLLFYENNLEEVISKLIKLYINCETTLDIYDQYSICYIKYKFMYIFTTLTDFNDIDLDYLNNTYIKQFCKILIDDTINNIDNLVIFLESIKKIQALPNFNMEINEVQSILLRTKNINVFINNYLDIIKNMIKKYNLNFVSDEIINTFTNMCILVLKTINEYKNTKFTIDTINYFDNKNILTKFEGIISKYYLEPKYCDNLLVNTDGKIIEYIKILEEEMLQQGIYRIHVEYKMKTFIDILERIHTENESKEDIEPPDELCDPIMQTLIENPIMLPNTDIIMDKGVISRHLLTDNYNPFNRDELTMESLEEFNQLPKIKESIYAFKNKIEQWKKTNFRND
jgi:hypothetical protein